MLARTYRLIKKEDFRKTYANRKSLANPLLVLYHFKKSHQYGPRIGISVSKKVGNAVIRNKVKRRIREAMRSYLPKITTGYDLVFVARIKIGKASFKEIEKSVENLLIRAKMIAR